MIIKRKTRISIIALLLITGVVLSVCPISKSASVSGNETGEDPYSEDIQGKLIKQFYDGNGNPYGLDHEELDLYEDGKVVFTANVKPDKELTYKWKLSEPISEGDEEDYVDRTEYARIDGNKLIVEAKDLPKEWFDLDVNESGKKLEVSVKAYQDDVCIWDTESFGPYDDYFYLSGRTVDFQWGFNDLLEENLHYVGDEVTIPAGTKVEAVYYDKDNPDGKRIERTLVDVKAKDAGKVVKNDEGSFTLSATTINDSAWFNLIVDDWGVDWIPQDYWTYVDAYPQVGEKHTVDGIKYEIIKNDFDNHKFTARIIGAKSSIKKTNLKDETPIGWNSYRIVSIAANAFKGKKKLTEVKISGAYLNSIGKNAFANCKKLKKFVIDNYNFKKIGSRAFYGDGTLKRFILKSTDLISVGSKAFSETSKKLTVETIKYMLKKYKKMIKKAGAPRTTKYIGKSAITLNCSI